MITKKGIVTATKMQGTVTVTVHHQVSHPLYKKSYRQSKKFLVDINAMKDIGVGDEVLIQECRPLSKRKHFLLKEVLKRVPRVSEMAEDASLIKAISGKRSAKSTSTSSSESLAPRSPPQADEVGSHSSHP